jgi:hypothetical protein
MNQEKGLVKDAVDRMLMDFATFVEEQVLKE